MLSVPSSIFNSEAADLSNIDERARILAEVQPEDLVEFGMIPELVGRLPIVSSLQPLDHAGLVKVLTEPKNALLRQYKTLFEMEECQLEFNDGALHAIADKALKKGTGARGLRSIVEEAMLEIMYELPDQPKGTKYQIDEDVIQGRKRLFAIPEAMQKSA